MKPQRTFATFEQVLFFLEKPELIVLSAGDRAKVVAVACRHLADFEYFGVKVNLRHFKDYLTEKYDLRYLFLHANLGRYFEFDLESYSEVIPLESVSLSEGRRHSFVPEHGLFARDHSEEYATGIGEQTARQRFNVDGQWDMREFSKFHSYVSDLYAVTRSIDIFVNEQEPTKIRRKVMQSFIKPWEGGGSYYGFFKSLSKAGGDEYRPRIGAIQWASPGYIDVIGQEESFERLIETIEHYGTNRKKIDRRYSELYSYMQQAKLLKQAAKTFDRKSSPAEELNLRAKMLAKELDVVRYRDLKKMAGNNPLVAAKVLLATERRVDRLYRFFSEGRLAVEGASVAG